MYACLQALSYPLYMSVIASLNHMSETLATVDF